MIKNSISRYSIPLTFYLGMYGQLGHGDSEKQSAAKMVKALEGKVVYLLACGNFHTVRGACTVLLYPLCTGSGMVLIKRNGYDSMHT